MNPVVSTIRQILKLTISLVLLGLLSGCGALGGAALTGVLMGGSMAPNRPPSPPKILCTAEDSIGLRYWTVEANTQHDEAMQIVLDHCGGAYVETRRVSSAMYSTVFIMCLQEDGSPPISPSCKYVESEQDPVGFGQEDWNYK